MEVAKNCMYLYIPYRCKIEQPDALQHNGMTNSDTEMCKWYCGFLLIKSSWKLLALKVGSASH